MYNILLVLLNIIALSVSPLHFSFYDTIYTIVGLWFPTPYYQVDLNKICDTKLRDSLVFLLQAIRHQ